MQNFTFQKWLRAPALAILLCLLFYLRTNAQTNPIIGRVTDSKSNEPIVGATVRAKAGSVSTQTDESGRFSLRVTDTTTLVISFVGYQTRELKASRPAPMVITLDAKTGSLDEIVVVGYGLSQKRATLSGAISTVSGEELSHARTATAPGALVGKVPGINFRQTTGRPGSEPAIQIRNFGTPLIVIDGTIRDYSNFSQMDFNDVESISVLKDASASIYGMQGANGVIVITTKIGKRNTKPTVTYQNYFGIQTPSGYNKPADAVTYLRALIQDETYNDVPDNQRTITRAEYDKWVNKVDDEHTSFDWYKYIWRTAPQYYNSFGFSGGSENMDYYVSAGHLVQKGSLRDFEGFRRTNFQANINSNISKRLKVGVGVIARLEHTEQPGLPGDDYGFAEQTAFRNLPTRKPYYNDNKQFPLISSPADPQFSYGWIGYNTSGKYQLENRVVQLNGNVEFEILKGLKARGLASYWFRNSVSDLLEKAPVLYAFDQAKQSYNIAYQGSGRYVERNFQNSEELSTNLQLEYKRSFNKHNFDVVAGAEMRKAKYPRLYVLGSPTANGIAYLSTSSLTAITDDISFTQSRLGYIGRLDYDYDGKYIAQFSGRYDGTFFYAPGKRFGFFPSGSLAYRVSQEDFWKNSSFLSNNINDFKIRGSYGVLGKELGTALSYITGYNYNQGSAILNGAEVISSRVTGLATSNISWGRVYTMDFGVNITVLNNRLSGGFDWFDRHQTGELGTRNNIRIPNEAGFSLPAENLNGDHTRGIDFSLNWRDNVGKVNYWVGGNLTSSRWITGERYNPSWSNAYSQYRDLSNVEGRYRDGSFQLVAVGQFKTWDEIARHPIDQDHRGNTTIRPGDYIYADTNNDGFITDLDMKNVTYRVNSGTPWVNFAFNFGANWNGIDFRADLVGSTGSTYEQQSYMRYFDPVANVSQYLADNSSWYNDIWNKNSGISVGKYPLLTKGVNNWMNTHWPNSFWQTNVNYVKLRNIELGYSLPTSVLKKIKFSNFRIYVAGQNVLTVSNMPGGLDPEIVSNAGISYPNPRVYTAGVQVKF
ncbi:SusC/RagA family TonB-linked outer membrane protein [Mucilaginibacter daejeonensis]|uniref:SusC/RagA family TonB-linked outer membrane protein n=1 Tax=Mucilaginibacter daejeonensis TaxID=398049 RepID=UPI001D174041|nr:SusC/RagA family TonB-linked outer membrane protein [Mucilaginibacter daejeonensis]UEG54800.1 SusC/RagA family TonB-linked outer membrane protein [Mucilaginibacter daejeonensis]